MFLKNDRVLTAMSIMLDVAFHAGRSGVVSGADIARRNGLLRRGIEPVFQLLSRARLLESVRGPKGGYRLGRSARVITLRDIAQTVCASESGFLDRSGDNPLFTDVLAPLWEEINDKVNKELAHLTLEDLVKRASRAGLKPLHQTPITFSI
ncbi:RrF2 family transcriptional regulator [Oecophyllibacter saccharovorans]|uniref:Rrf2 family transcriptional regulator n=1 Tax=Oecophyllibacter saccharovorans TaxID=2558360 RepID=A0A506UL84_9PROT|nr:Rrf2 family transcriptional regulator [Oecophyllibacter saccharovorans]QDH15261.1 Rrf2 family transcriptional regulator [Oecophyllibacter saccharovorans]TPW34096.1 Rrf2 family transcriptional regulator [Oecophyllibacter saccharovorans]TPW36278.1 Rrf2 family transcriptional regulator [Oecophyllibacter saccharovorans]